MAQSGTQSNREVRSGEVVTSFTHWANSMTSILAQNEGMYVAWFAKVEKELVSKSLIFTTR